MNEAFNPTLEDVLVSLFTYAQEHKNQYKVETEIKIDNYPLFDHSITWYSNTKHEVSSYKKHEKLFAKYIKELSKKDEIRLSEFDYDQGHNLEFENKLAIRKYILGKPISKVDNQTVKNSWDILLIVQNLVVTSKFKHLSIEYRTSGVYGINVRTPNDNRKSSLSFTSISSDRSSDSIGPVPAIIGDDVWKTPILIDLFSKSTYFSSIYLFHKEISYESPDLQVNEIFNWGMD